MTLSNEVKRSVNTFIDEMQSRIPIYSQTNALNLDIESYKKVYDIIFNKTRRSPNEIKIDDITLFVFDEIETILDIVCTDRVKLPQILNVYNANVYAKKTSKDPQVISDLNTYFETIRKMIISYITEYDERNNKEDIYNQEKIDKCKKYIELFSKEDLEHYMTLEEYNEFIKDIKNFGILEKDICNLIIYLNYLNLRLSRYKKEDVSLTCRVSLIGTKYLTDNKIMVDHAKKIISSGIDLDLLKSEVDDYANTNGLKNNLLYNTVLALAINSYYHKYIDLLANKERIEEVKEIKDILIDLLNILDNSDELIIKAKDILESHEYLLNESRKDFYRFIDMTTEEVENEIGTKEGKLIPILIKIEETLNHLVNIKDNETEINSVRKLLEELIKEYESVLERINEKTLTKE